MALANSKERNKKFKISSKSTYRMVILNDETFEEVSSHKLTLRNIYVLISSFVVALGLLIVACIVFTPVKKLIPGYADFESNPKFIQITQDLESIQDSIAAQEIYLSSLRQLLTADGSTLKLDRDIKPIQSPAPANLTIVEPKGAISLTNKQISPPIQGLISLQFDPKINHFGIDILAPKDSPIKAISEGHVISSGWNLETGHTIGIQHANRLISFYKHNQKNLKKEGDFVKAGEAIAIIGNSGTLSDGPHLHFELWYNGIPVNPEDYIKLN